VSELNLLVVIPCLNEEAHIAKLLQQLTNESPKLIVVADGGSSDNTLAIVNSYCKNYPNIKLINLGSSCIYPLDASNPIVEESFMSGKLEPTNSPYAMAKLTAIEMGNALKIQHGHKIINLMPTNLYGPNDNFDLNNSHVIPGLISRFYNAVSTKSSEISIWGTGAPLREFLYVEDFANAIEFLLEKEWEHELLNIGSGEEVSIKQLAYLLKEISGFKGDIIFDPSKPDGNPKKLLNLDKINSLGWKSSTPLEVGLKKTYQWYLDNIA